MRVLQRVSPDQQRKFYGKILCSKFLRGGCNDIGEDKGFRKEKQKKTDIRLSEQQKCLGYREDRAERDSNGTTRNVV